MSVRLNPILPATGDVILVGDPRRAFALGQALTVQPAMSHLSRGLWGYRGETAGGLELTVQATGVGGPSAVAVISDLVAMGARRLIRLGSCTATGPDPAGADPAGPESAEVDPVGADPAGVDPAGPESAGADPAGADPAGPDPAGPDSNRSDETGRAIEPGRAFLVTEAYCGDGAGLALNGGERWVLPDLALLTALGPVAEPAGVFSHDLLPRMDGHHGPPGGLSGGSSLLRTPLRDLQTAATLAAARSFGVQAAAVLMVAEDARGNGLDEAGLEERFTPLARSITAVLEALPNPQPEG
jgi:hypothetical protein